MKLSFHGADRGVTGFCQCGGRRILVDCGLYQGGHELDEESREAYGDRLHEPLGPSIEGLYRPVTPLAGAIA